MVGLGLPELFIICGLILIPVLLIVAVLILYSRRSATPQAASAALRLADEMDLELLHGDRQRWFGGFFADRAFALALVPLLPRQAGDRAGAGGQRRGLRLVMEVRVRTPLGAAAYRGHHTAARTADFGEAFPQQQDAHRLTAPARAALLDFVRQGRSLRLSDRKDAPAALLPDGVLPNAVTVLVHDRPGSDASAATVRALLDDMAAVASVLEREANAGGVTPGPQASA